MKRQQSIVVLLLVELFCAIWKIVVPKQNVKNHKSAPHCSLTEIQRQDCWVLLTLTGPIIFTVTKCFILWICMSKFWCRTIEAKAAPPT